VRLHRAVVAGQGFGEARFMLKRGMVNINSIKPHMPVVCSEGGQFAVVDHIASDNRTIKLAKDATGRHHYIPISWVTSVDGAVHIDRPGDQAMREWSSEAA
jgi:hypothetical protein